MTEVGVSVAAKLAEYLVAPTVRQLQYLFCVGKITINVEIKKEELILKQGSVQERVQEAINRTDRIDGEVEKWQDDAGSLIAEVENLEQELRASNSCLRGWCPTWRRYRLCKKLSKTTQRMIDLTTKSDRFNPFSHPVIAPDIEKHSSQNFKLFNSTKMAFDQLWDALKDDGSFIIGLWGMGGSGKTSLVTEVKNKAKDSGLFDRVVLSTISQNPPIRDIQGEIADKLGLKLEEESNKGRADRIALRLQSGERILMILDDLWTKLNLEDIGIPFGGNFQRSCKVVLTTRRSKVCDSMDCQKTIQLNLLKDDEAWTLFQTYANVDDAAQVVAREIAMECKGLPIAIVALGTCLKRKGVEDMNVMLSRLRNAMLNNVEDEDVRDAFRCLKLSYDFLATDQAKLLLLMCAMFPEDHSIAVEDLFAYGVGLGLCRGVDSFEKVREEVGTTIKYLIESSLLMDNSSRFNVQAQKYVKLHDMVRDVALWIASEEHRAIMVIKELDKLIVDEAVNNWYAFSSWYANNGLLPFLSQLDAPKLEFLLLRSSELLEISHATFEGTKGLKALIIMGTNWPNKIELQPQSIQHLSNLQTLRLQNWNLRDISFVVNLIRLEILDLQGSVFARVPDGIEKLNKLKLLNLSRCIIDECCYKVIGRCSQLEELYVSKHCSHPRNTNCYEYLGGSTALLEFRRYNLEVGDIGLIIDSFYRNEGTRSLRLGQLNISLLGARIKDLAQRATAIQFYELEVGSKCFTPNIVQAVGGMNELTNLYLQRCSEIECITDETTPHEDAFLPRLDGLMIYDMGNLKQLCLGPSPFSLFQKLERLIICKCPQLHHIFPADCNLGNLKFLEISGCPMLTSIFPISTACTLLSLEELRIRQCNELKHVLAGEGGGDAWGNSRFPKLKKLSINGCCKLEYAFPVFLVQKFEQLQDLSIQNAPWMKFVFGEEQPMHDPDETQIVLPPLEYLHLRKLPNLVGICSKKYCLRQSAIKKITCWNCPNMNLQEINEDYVPLTAIESIILGNCGAESIFPYQTGIKEQIPTFQYLQQLTLEKCARVKVVFSTHTHQCLPKLTYVSISCCEELEAIFMGNEETQKNLPIVESCLLKLKCLQISKCNKLKFILPFMIGATTSMLSQLSTLMISDCSQMEEIFKCSNIEDHDIDSEREIKFPDMERMELKNLPRLVNICQGFKLHVNICQGFKLRTWKFCGVVVHECPKLMPIFNATIDWTKERLVREYELKYNQINNKEALNLPLSVLIVGELDIQGPKVEHKWRVVGDDEQEETNDSKMLRSEQQMLGGLVPTQVLCFQYLHSLEVTHIKKLKFLFSMRTIVQNSLPKLNYLTLSDCEELEEIIAKNEEHQTESNVQVGFPELRELKVERCNKLKRLFSMSAATIVFSAQSLPELISVIISQCEELEAVFSMNKETQNVSITESCLMKLKSLKISECNKLQFVLSFIISAATSMLPQLSTLNVSYCSQMEEIFKVSNIEDDIDNEREIMFPDMEHMELKNLPRLVNFCQGFKLHTGEFYRVEVHDCPKFMPIKSATVDWTKETLVREYELKYNQLNNNEALNLPLSILIAGELDIQGPKVEHKWRVVGDDEQEETNDSNMLRSEQQMLGGLVPTQVLYFQYLHSLKVTDSKKLKFLFSMSTIVQNSLPKLYSLSLYDCEQLEVIFGHSGEDDAHYGDTIVLSSLRKIELTNLPNFMSVCQVELQIQVELSNISICNCPKFVDSSLGWALEQLGTKSVSTEESNVQISSNAEQLLGNEGKGMKMLISKAEELRLENSMNLTSVWERPTFIMFQNLKWLYVIKCRRLKCIMPTTATRSLPCLLLLEIEECEELEEVMSLEEEEEHNHFPNESSNSSLCFPQLHTLKVKRCMKLKWLFPSLPSTQRLPYLRFLVIEQCSELKGVCNGEGEIHEEGFYNNLLPKLQYLTVQDCPMFSETTLAALQRHARREDECRLLTLYESQLEYRKFQSRTRRLS